MYDVCRYITKMKTMATTPFAIGFPMAQAKINYGSHKI
jgi:hypothetical protein